MRYNNFDPPFFSFKVKKKEFPYLPTHTSEWWVGLGQTEIFLSLA
jgi:hypothetical protein